MADQIDRIFCAISSSASASKAIVSESSRKTAGSRRSARAELHVLISSPDSRSGSELICSLSRFSSSVHGLHHAPTKEC